MPASGAKPGSVSMSKAFRFPGLVAPSCPSLMSNWATFKLFLIDELTFPSPAKISTNAKPSSVVFFEASLVSRQASLTAAKFRLKQTSTTKNMKAWAESHMKSKWDLRGTGGNHAKDKLVKRFLVRHLLGPRHHETDRYRKHALSRNRQDMARMQEMESPRKCASAAWPHRSSLPHSPPHAQRSMAGGTMHGHWPARQTKAASFIDHAHFPTMPANACQ